MQNAGEPALANPLKVEAVRSALANARIGHHILYARTVPSTMPLAHQTVRESTSREKCAGLVIVAEEQTAGRGRLSRGWDAPPGRGLLISVVIAPPFLPILSAQLPMITGLAVLDALRQTVPMLARHLHLKWPNDVVILGDGALGKLAGMLIESSFGTHGLDYAVLGIGINVNQRAGELPPPRVRGLPPVSLHRLLHHDISREELLISLCRNLERWLAPVDPPSPQEIQRCWQTTLINLGQTVTVRTNATEDEGAPLIGKVVNTTLTGSLIIETADGEQRQVDVGDAEFDWNQP